MFINVVFARDHTPHHVLEYTLKSNLLMLYKVDRAASGSIQERLGKPINTALVRALSRGYADTGGAYSIAESPSKCNQAVP